jgi:hypothetical protein
MFGGFTIPEDIKDKIYMIVGLTTFPFIRRTPKEVYEEGIKEGLFIKREVQQRTLFLFYCDLCSCSFSFVLFPSLIQFVLLG